MERTPVCAICLTREVCLTPTTLREVVPPSKEECGARRPPGTCSVSAADTPTRSSACASQIRPLSELSWPASNATEYVAVGMGDRDMQASDMSKPPGDGESVIQLDHTEETLLFQPLIPS